MSSSKKVQILLFIFINGTMFIFGFLENIKGVSFPLIKTEFDVSYETQGRMVSFLSFSYTFFCLIGGFILSRFGVKKLYIAGFLFAFAGLVSVFFMPGYWTVALALFFVFSCFGLFEIGVNALASILFTGKAALFMMLMHFFYGIGAVVSPRGAGFVSTIPGLNWRHAYLFSIPLVLLFFIPCIILRFPGQSEQKAEGESDDVRKVGFAEALRTPKVWFFGLTLGLMISVEIASSNWGNLYFQDVYGFDPATKGAWFVSAYFVMFTLSRLVSGFIIEKLGYVRSLIYSVLGMIAVFSVGFSLGPNGIFVLPLVGFFVSIHWPTIMAVGIKAFGKNAPVISSAVIAIGGFLSAAFQYLIGHLNNVIGAAWGYRSCLVVEIIILGMLFRLKKLVPSVK